MATKKDDEAPVAAQPAAERDCDRVELNDPHVSGREAVARALGLAAAEATTDGA